MLTHFMRQQRAELGPIRGIHRESDFVSSSRKNFLCQNLPVTEWISWWSGEATIAGRGQAMESRSRCVGKAFSLGRGWTSSLMGFLLPVALRTVRDEGTPSTIHTSTLRAPPPHLLPQGSHILGEFSSSEVCG